MKRPKLQFIAFLVFAAAGLASAGEKQAEAPVALFGADDESVRRAEPTEDELRERIREKYGLEERDYGRNYAGLSRQGEAFVRMFSFRGTGAFVWVGVLTALLAAWCKLYVAARRRERESTLKQALRAGESPSTPQP